jgi:hypothetical protein
MSLQNRVDPWGAIIRSAARGTLMGTRGGALHNEQRRDSRFVHRVGVGLPAFSTSRAANAP